MPTFVAFLRGVNVGKAKRVPMADFRALLSSMGFADVVTHLNSGNAVFRAAKGPSAAHAAAIAGALLQRMAFDVPVIVKAAAELAAIVAENPIEAEAAEHPRLLVALTQERKALAGLKAIRPLVAPPERFAVGRNAAYLFCPPGIHQSRAWAALLGKAGGAATTRNWATVLKLHSLASGDDDRPRLIRPSAATGIARPRKTGRVRRSS
ncbi:MAG TPA: DUF1697 domain-containing protein [Thermoanaerobaculia bacterium]|nr:DUF1697 domain-containing protein [Thermoanaerobaculia bacterium]